MNFIIPFITATFAFGTAIFYCLYCVEKSVLKLVFNKGKIVVTEDNIRFTHKALKRLSPLLPPANGFVILFGISALIYQCNLQSWNFESLSIPLFYIGITLYIIFIGKIATAVKNLMTIKSDQELSLVTANVRHLITQHHIALFANLGVVILEFALFT
ncbi:MAG: hypothetical protein ABIX01_00785 [Chitinophagaceae bacterium]